MNTTLREAVHLGEDYDMNLRFVKNYLWKTTGQLFRQRDVIKMIIKGRSPTMRHVSRTHRVALDWLFDRINLEPTIQIKYVDTKNQLADMLAYGSVNGIHPAPDIHEHFTTHKGYGTLRISSRTTSTILSTL